MQKRFRFLSKIKGFTLIELIIVVAIIGLLAASAFVAVNPGKRVGDASDAKRWSDITAIADAIAHYSVDNTGSLPSAVSSASANTEYMIHIAGDSDTGSETCAATGNSIAKRDIATGIVPNYVPTMPRDPDITKTEAETDGIGYYMVKDSEGRIKIGACNESIYATVSIVVQR